MPLDKPISKIAPAGYDQKLWDSIPSVRAQKYRGKHETYVYGQSSADGTACIGCAWQIPGAVTGPTAIAQHDKDMRLLHDHDVWVPIERGPEAGLCPCGNQAPVQLPPPAFAVLNIPCTAVLTTTETREQADAIVAQNPGSFTYMLSEHEIRVLMALRDKPQRRRSTTEKARAET